MSDDLKSRDDIENELARAQDLREAQGGVPKWPGMTYEQGVEAALLWVLGDSDDPPIED